MASIPAREFERVIREQKEAEHELTSAAVLRVLADPPAAKEARAAADALPYRPANGLQYAGMAIANLEKILPNAKVGATWDAHPWRRRFFKKQDCAKGHELLLAPLLSGQTWAKKLHRR